MKRPLFPRIMAAAVFAAAALGIASTAQARPDIQVSIGLPGLPGLPVFVPPPVPVFVQPRPVYAPPAVVYERPWRPSYRYEGERERTWRQAEWQRREWERREWERREWQHRHHDRSPSHDRGRW